MLRLSRSQASHRGTVNLCFCVISRANTGTVPLLPLVPGETAGTVPMFANATTGTVPVVPGLGRANTWVRPYIIGGPTSDFRLPISDIRSNVPLPAVLLNFSGHGTVNTSPYPPPIPGQCRDLRNFRCLLIRQLLLLK